MIKLLRTTPFDIPLLLLLILARLSIWQAYDGVAAWQKFWLLVTAVAIFYLLVFWQRHGESYAVSAAAIAWLLVVAGAAISLIFMLTANWAVLGIELRLPAEIGRILSMIAVTSIHPNVAAGILAAILPFAIALILMTQRLPSPIPRLAATVLTAIIICGLLISYSRAAWLALGVAASLWLLWHLISRVVLLRNRRAVTFCIIIGTVILSVVIVFLTAPGSMLDLMRTLLADQGRFDLYRDGIVLALDYPFFGAGLDTFTMVHATYAYLTHVGFASHAHNILLDVSIEMGIGGVLLLLWIAVQQARITVNYARSHSITPWLGAATLSTLIIFLHGMLDDPLYSSRALPLLFVPIAFAVPYARQTTSQFTRRAVPAAGVVALIVCVLLWQPMLSTILSNWGALLQSREELSLYQWPEWSLQDQMRVETDLSEPIYYFEEALSRNPNNITANRRLGQIELSQGNFATALMHLDAVYQRMPWDNSARQMLGETYIVTGDARRGVALWSEVDNSNGQLNTRAYWYGLLGDVEQQQQIRLALSQIAPLATFDPDAPVPPLSN
jgi:O-antigen ligase